MNKSEQPNHWNCLAAELGAEPTPKADNEKAVIGGSRTDPSAESAPPRAVNQSGNSRSTPPATDWDSLAGELGLQPENNSQDKSLSNSQPEDQSAPPTGSQESSTELGTPTQAPPSQPWSSSIKETQASEAEIPNVAETASGEVPQPSFDEITQTDEERLEVDPFDPQADFTTPEIETSEKNTTEIDVQEGWSLDEDHLPIESATAESHEQGENVSESSDSLSEIFGLSADGEFNDFNQSPSDSAEKDAEKRLEMIFDVDSAEKPDSEKYDLQIDETSEDVTDQAAANKDDSGRDDDTVTPQSRQRHGGRRKRQSSSPTNANPDSSAGDSTDAHDPNDIEIAGNDSEDESNSTNTTRRRRKRRRRGSRSDERVSPESDNGSSDEETDFNSETKDVTTTDAVDTTGDLDTSEQSAHRQIPSWQDAIGTIVSNNIASRSRQSRSEGSKGRGRGRGRGRGSKSDSKK